MLRNARSCLTLEIFAELNSALEEPDEIDKSSWNERDDRDGEWERTGKVDGAVAWYTLMDNRISVTVPTSNPRPRLLFSRAYKDKLDIAARKKPSSEPYNYFALSSASSTRE